MYNINLVWKKSMWTEKLKLEEFVELEYENCCVSKKKHLVSSKSTEEEKEIEVIS